MKVKHTLSMLALAACAALSTSVMAQNAPTVTITGEVGSDICNITVNGTSNLQMPKISISQIPTVGSTAPGTTLDVTLDNCASHVSSAQINFSSVNARGDGRVDSGVNGVSIQVYSPSNNQQTFVTASASNDKDRRNAYEVVVSGGRAQLRYGVRYYRESMAAATGQLNATLQLTVAYM